MLATLRLALARSRQATIRLGEGVGECVLHDLHVDDGLNWSLVAFSGSESKVFRALKEIASTVYSTVDLNRHTCLLERVGAIEAEFVGECGDLIDRFAEWQWDEWSVPTLQGTRDSLRLQAIRRGGFGGAMAQAQTFDQDRPLNPTLGVCLTFHPGFMLRLIAEVICPVAYLPLIPEMISGISNGTAEAEAVDMGGIVRTVITANPAVVSADDVHNILRNWRPLAGRATLIGALRPFDLHGAETVIWHERQVWSE
ncbi:MAG TPA: hypothetical protein PKA27_06080 [Fimbriimonadaceae bacterium]|nr:hypothetical protein [Fimbriimonadaceae bacterium]